VSLKQKGEIRGKKERRKEKGEAVANGVLRGEQV